MPVWKNGGGTGMRVSYMNFNGRVVLEQENILTGENRAFRYGDGLFETMLWTEGRIRFLDYHIQRLQQGMQMLHLEGIEKFDAGFIESAAGELIARNEFTESRIRLRLQVYRNGTGLYSPVINQAAFVLSVQPIKPETDLKANVTGLIVDLYPEHFKPVSGLSALKSINSLIFVLAGVYRKNKGLDEVLILNQDGHLCESVSSNIFVVYQKQLYTPALSEGCVNGVMRRVVLEEAKKMDLEIVEAKIDPQVLDEADEVFLTNAIHGVQGVVGYRSKRYFHQWSKIFQDRIHQVGV